MIKSTTTKGKKKITLTSTYFEGLKDLRKSKFDTDFYDMKGFNTNELRRQYAIQELVLFKNGCRELTEYVNKLPSNLIKDVVTVYAGQDYIER